MSSASETDGEITGAAAVADDAATPVLTSAQRKKLRGALHAINEVITTEKGFFETLQIMRSALDALSDEDLAGCPRMQELKTAIERYNDFLQSFSSSLQELSLDDEQLLENIKTGLSRLQTIFEKQNLCQRFIEIFGDIILHNAEFKAGIDDLVHKGKLQISTSSLDFPTLFASIFKRSMQYPLLLNEVVKNFKKAKDEEAVSEQQTTAVQALFDIAKGVIDPFNERKREYETKIKSFDLFEKNFAKKNVRGFYGIGALFQGFADPIDGYMISAELLTAFLDTVSRGGLLPEGTTVAEIGRSSVDDFKRRYYALVSGKRLDKKKYFEDEDVRKAFFWLGMAIAKSLSMPKPAKDEELSAYYLRLIDDLITLAEKAEKGAVRETKKIELSAALLRLAHKIHTEARVYEIFEQDPSAINQLADRGNATRTDILDHALRRTKQVAHPRRAKQVERNPYAKSLPQFILIFEPTLSATSTAPQPGGAGEFGDDVGELAPDAAEMPIQALVQFRERGQRCNWMQRVEGCLNNYADTLDTTDGGTKFECDRSRIASEQTLTVTQKRDVASEWKCELTVNQKHITVASFDADKSGKFAGEVMQTIGCDKFTISDEAACDLGRDGLQSLIDKMDASGVEVMVLDKNCYDEVLATGNQKLLQDAKNGTEFLDEMHGVPAFA